MFDDSDLTAADKCSKVRPLLCWLNERWLLYSPTKKHLFIDESMVPYYGRHGTKEHSRDKPVRFGYKLWSIATSAGYMLQCEPSQGKSTGNLIPKLGIRGSVIVDRSAKLPRNKKYFLYFDNLFTSLKLMDYPQKMTFWQSALSDRIELKMHLSETTKVQQAGTWVHRLHSRLYDWHTSCTTTAL